MRIVSTVSIPNARVIEGTVFQKRIESTLDEMIGEGNGYRFPMDNYGDTIARVSETAPPEAVAEHDTSEYNHSTFIKFSSEIEDPKWKYNDSDSVEFTQSVHESLVGRFYDNRIRMLFTIANIARVGSIEVERIVTNVGSLTTSFDRTLSASHLRVLFLEDEAPKWPPISDLPLHDAWSWALQEDGFLDGFGGTRISRALNAFTFLLEPMQELSASLLMWAMVGVESLFARSKKGLIEQIRTKSISLHGEKEGILPLMSNMYKYRSQFIHGSIGFSGADPLHDTGLKQDENDRNLLEAQRLSTALLVSTIQLLIRKEAHKMGF